HHRANRWVPNRRDAGFTRRLTAVLAGPSSECECARVLRCPTNRACLLAPPPQLNAKQEYPQPQKGWDAVSDQGSRHDVIADHVERRDLVRSQGDIHTRRAKRVLYLRRKTRWDRIAEPVPEVRAGGLIEI